MAAQTGSDGGEGDSLETRVIRIEVFAEDARERLTRIEKRLDSFEDRFIRLEARLEDLSVQVVRMSARLDVFAEKLDGFAKKLDGFAEKLDQFVTKDMLAASMAELEARLLKWFVVTIFATASLAFTAAKLVH
ncbi:hypothetical protein E4L96_20755 [Massilia arenosa]|uniref:DUF1640 domain-containing protein n=1 Tax=Zemynaea arenosa TaxID=2561931 RepID=A0A4Y9RR96_9BURK|nr:hypothetical protein [Massilia arenosa]TFW11630.1 hypothetical protein E4L96_20755 [Massilia arenosa]